MPPIDEMNKTLRHETSIEQQLYRVMAQLARHQSRRKGDSFLPPST